MFNLICPVALALICLALVAESSLLRTLNIDKTWTKWNKNLPIPFTINPAYTSGEAMMIRTAINAVQTQLAHCPIRFQEVARNNTSPKLHITPLTGESGSQAQSVCYSYPGNYTQQQNATKEQIVSIARGSYGCIDGSLHSIMKYIIIALGKRSEHQRGDRDAYIKVSPNLSLPSAYRLYSGTVDAVWTLYPTYDFCSITHNQPNEYGNGGPAFTIVPGTLPGFIPKLDTISLLDCKWLSALYNCTASACQQQPCSSMTTPVPTSTAAATTTITTTASVTTTAPAALAIPAPVMCSPAVNFCTVKIDEGTMVYDGRVVVFSGSCATEVDTTTGAMKGPARTITSLFPGSTAITGPVISAWTDVVAGVQTTHILTGSAQYKCTATAACASETPMLTGSQGAFEFDGQPPAPAGTLVGYKIETAPATTGAAGTAFIPMAGGTEVDFMMTFTACNLPIFLGLGDATCEQITTGSVATATGAWKTTYNGQAALAVIGMNDAVPPVQVINFMAKESATMPTPGNWYYLTGQATLSTMLCPGSG